MKTYYNNSPACNMKIRQLVDSVVKRFVSPDPNANNKEIEELKKLGFTEIRNPSMLSEKELEELKKHPGFQPDILGQPVGRKLGHVSAFSLATFYKEEYTTALEIAEQFNELVDDEEQMAFWDKHPEVFGDASIIVFDQQQKKYFPYHGQPMGNILSGLDGPEERYEVARMYPAHVSSFDLFMEWCTKKCPYWNNYKVITEAYYWEQMKAYAEFDNGFEKDFLIKELSGAEEYRDGIKEPFNILGYNYCPDEIAEQHFLFYGNQDGSGVLPGVFDSSFNLFTVYNKLITCPLSHYGSIFSKYFHGFQAAQMVAFLRKQKKRLDKDEDIRYLDSQVMASSITNMQSQGVVQDSSGHNPIDSSPGDKSMVASPIIYIEPDKGLI